LIHIAQSYPDENSVVIKVEGRLDSESLPVLADTYRQALESGKETAIDLGKITNIDREGKGFLEEIQDTVQLIDVPLYIKMQIDKR